MIQIKVDVDRITNDNELVDLIVIMALLGELAQNAKFITMSVFAVLTQCLYDDVAEKFLDGEEANNYMLQMSYAEFILASQILCDQFDELNNEARLAPFKAKFGDRL